MPARILEGCDGERSAPAGGDPHDYIVLANLALRHLARPEASGIFTRFNRGVKGSSSSRDHELHHARIDSKGWRTLRGIERPQPSAGAGAYVNQAPTLANAVRNPVDSLGDLRYRL